MQIGGVRFRAFPAAERIRTSHLETVQFKPEPTTGKLAPHAFEGALELSTQEGLTWNKATIWSATTLSNLALGQKENLNVYLITEKKER